MHRKPLIFERIRIVFILICQSIFHQNTFESTLFSKNHSSIPFLETYNYSFKFRFQQSASFRVRHQKLLAVFIPAQKRLVLRRHYREVDPNMDTPSSPSLEHRHHGPIKVPASPAPMSLKMARQKVRVPRPSQSVDSGMYYVFYSHSICFGIDHQKYSIT